MAGLGRFPSGLFISGARPAVVEIQSQPPRPAKLSTSSGYIECGYRMQPRDPTVHRLMSWTRPIPAEESFKQALGRKVSRRLGSVVHLTDRWPQRPERLFLLRLFGSSWVLWIKRGHPTLLPLLCMLLFGCMYCLFFPIFCLYFFVHLDMPAHAPQTVHSSPLTTDACGRSQSLHVVAIRWLLLFPLLIDYIFLAPASPPPPFLPSCVTNKQGGEAGYHLYTHAHAYTDTRTDAHT